ncbi:MAG: hypothetical protein LC732_07730, partial [Acidobacteria bacterium]|nr:hypothetical protein [Acidobacteriota bacterium]
GIGSVRLEWSPLAQPRIDATPAYPPTLAPAPVALQVPHDAAPDSATLRLVAEDRAGRSVSSETLAYTIVENAPPQITAFDATPAALYPGATATLVAAASDDVKITTLTLRALIGETEVKSQSYTINAASSGDRTFTYTVPPATTGGQTLRFEAIAADGFPGRGPTVQSGDIAILVDTNPPSVSINTPAEGAVFPEGSGNTIDVSVAASDAEVEVKSVMAEIEGGSTVALALSGSVWTGKIPVPSVDGTVDVPRLITVTATDYAGNSATASRGVLIQPHLDANAPVVNWSCPTAGALFPSGHPVKLRVHALGNDVGGIANGVDTVAFYVDDSETPIEGQPVAGMTDYFESKTPAIVTGVEGQIVTIRAVVTNVGGIANQASTTFTIVEGIVVTADLTIDDANAATYENETLIISAGTTTIVGPRSFARLVVLDGAKVTHPGSSGGESSRLHLGAAKVYVACEGAIDVSGRGYAGSQTYPGAAVPGPNSGGSHLGVGGVMDLPAGTAYGSVYRPQEAGAGGEHASAGMAGGGVVRITADAVIVDGAIRANGADGGTGRRGGAGGSIWITAPGYAGSGRVEARGGNAHFGAGGGGAIAIEYTREATRLPSYAVHTGTSGYSRFGGAGTVWTHGASSVYGDLLVDNAGKSGQATELPALGSGVALTGSGGTTLVTDRAIEIPEYFVGHWVAVSDPEGALRGRWRIASVNGTSVTLSPNGTEAVEVNAGDHWSGIYRFDSLSAPGGGQKITSADPIVVGTGGAIALSGPTTAGAYLELTVPIVAEDVTVSGNVAVPGVEARNLTIRDGILSH